MQIFLYITQKKSTPKGALSRSALRSVLLVVLVSADFPEVLRQGLATAGGVALREERGVVLVDLHEVFTTQCHCLAYRIEACPDEQLLCRRIGRANVRLSLADVHAGAVGVGGCSLAVRTDEVIAVLVAVLFLRLCKATLCVLDTRRIGYYCHSRVFFMVYTFLSDAFFQQGRPLPVSSYLHPTDSNCILSIVPWRSALTWHFERKEPRGALLRPRLYPAFSPSRQCPYAPHGFLKVERSETIFCKGKARIFVRQGENQ